MSLYQKRLYYWDLLVAVMILVGIALINWIDTRCIAGNC
jgi:hypothetical protein